MIEAVIKSSVILIITLSVFPLLRRQSAAVRHAVLTISLLCSIGVPILSPLLPSWPAAEKIQVRPGFFAAAEEHTNNRRSSI
jgi:hypothetical protein